MNDSSYVGRADIVGSFHVSVIQEVPHNHAHQAAVYQNTNYVKDVGKTLPTATVENCKISGPYPGTVTVQDPADVTVPDWTRLTDEELFSKFDNDFLYLKPIMDGLPSDLDHCERRKVGELLLRNSGTFSSSEFHIGCTNLLQQRINTGNHPPISEPLRRHPRAHLDLTDETVDKLKEAGVPYPPGPPTSFW